MRGSPTRASRGAGLGLIAVLLMLSGFAIWAPHSTQQSVARTRSAVYLSELYDQAWYQIGAEESLERRYRAEPGPRPRALHAAAATSLTTLLLTIHRNGGATDRRSVDYVMTLQAHYLIATRILFAAADGRRHRRVVWVDHNLVDPTFDSIEGVMGPAAVTHRRRAQRLLATLVTAQGTAVTTTPIVFTIGLLLLGVFWALPRRYQREREAAREVEVVRLERASRTDPLTTLGNHRAFQEEFQAAMTAARRHGDPLCLARIDIDEFKYVNDQKGHLHGDSVLVEFGKLLRTEHATDSVYRLGGDEFAVLMSSTPLAGARVAMERLREDAESRLSGVTISIGVAAFNPSDRDADAVHEQADATLYEAKRRSRNAVVTFDEIQDSTAIFSSTKTSAVRRLLAEPDVRVAFQPIWSLSEGGLIGYEALIRPSPEYGLAGPREAFEIAEHMGRAHALDVVCLQAVLARAAELPPAVSLFINLSPHSLDHDLLSGPTLVRAVEAAGISPSRVVFEITERSTVRLAVMVGRAQLLRDLGFRLALDHVGVGNAGLKLLGQLAVDSIKVDRTVIRNAVTDVTADAVLAAIIAFARTSGSTIIFEGVESEATLEHVREHVRDGGAAQVQGYLLGRPSETLTPVISVPRALSGPHARSA